MPIEVRVIRAGDQDGAGRESKGDTTSQVKGARHILARRELDGASRLSRGINSGLNGASVFRPAVALCAIAARVERGGFARSPPGARKKPGGEEDAGTPPESSPREIHGHQGLAASARAPGPSVGLGRRVKGEPESLRKAAGCPWAEARRRRRARPRWPGSSPPAPPARSSPLRRPRSAPRPGGPAESIRARARAARGGPRARS